MLSTVAEAATASSSVGSLAMSVSERTPLVNVTGYRHWLHLAPWPSAATPIVAAIDVSGSGSTFARP